MITTQILTKNNEATIERTLESLKGVPGEIVVADLGSTDNTVEICKKHGAKVFSAKLKHDYSALRNLIVEQSKNEWQMYLKPWECFSELTLKPVENSRFFVLTGDILTKELRLWKKGTARFERPVYESLEPGTGKPLDVYLWGEVNAGLGQTQEILTKWKMEEPLAPEPDYYLACTYLMHRQNDDFIRLAEHYLFQKNASDESVLMIRYYLAMVYCYVKRNPVQSLNNIMECIAAQPMMAEFWCMLGDIYLHMKEFERAKIFYQNAIDMGSQRKLDDTMPMELPKYEDYPKKMIEAVGVRT
jgi:tetratricopeptide (TPR) repeat protein